MSRRSKRVRGLQADGAAGDSNDVTANAKTKAPKISLAVDWEWEGDGGKWSGYAPEHAQSVTDALVRGDPDVTLQITKSVKMKVRFETMTQMNVGTGWQRNVRCLPSSSSSSSSATSKAGGIWEYHDNADSWRVFPAPVQRLLGACQLCGVDFVRVERSPGHWSKVDIKAMKHVDEAAGETDKVRYSELVGWQWKDEHGQWRDYSSVICLQIESVYAPFSAGKSTVDTVSFSTEGRSYTVDLGNLEQENVTSRVRRDVRRLVPAAMTTVSVPSAEPTSSTPGATATARGSARKKGQTSSSSSKAAASSGDAGQTSSSSSKAAASSGEAGSSAETTDGHVMMTFTGKVPVDYACSQKVGKAHLYCEGGQFWDATLNQTNLRNNNNKFYILQLLEDNVKRTYSTWFRWGRVGKTGQNTLMEHGTDLDQAKQTFMKKFSDKTLNQWADRESFVKHPGKYDLLFLDYEAKDEPDVGAPEGEDGENPQAKKLVPDSKLDKRLQNLIELIANVQTMEDLVMEMKYDAKKAPLGKLTVDQIRFGYTALKKIEDCINSNHYGDRLVQACDEFYTRIPHCFGMRRPPIIRTKEEVKEKLALLEALGDIQIAMKVLSGGMERDEHPTDRHYHGLKCNLSPVEPGDEVFKLVDKYVHQTHARTHNQYKLEVVDVFEIEREGERAVFQDVGNRTLLWHGSRLTNWVGILSQGLRIAPPEAPVTGYMFGKGVYFADMCSKSANYCFASRAKTEGCILLCEVALGDANDLLVADYTADKLPRGKHSTRGLGSVAPDPSQNKTLPDGCLVPLGTSVDTGVHNPRGYTLNYNEYVVYDTSQIRMRYLIRLKFLFK